MESVSPVWWDLRFLARARPNHSGRLLRVFARCIACQCSASIRPILFATQRTQEAGATHAFGGRGRRREPAQASGMPQLPRAHMQPHTLTAVVVARWFFKSLSVSLPACFGCPSARADENRCRRRGSLRAVSSRSCRRGGPGCGEGCGTDKRYERVDQPGLQRNVRSRSRRLGGGRKRRSCATHGWRSVLLPTKRSTSRASPAPMGCCDPWGCCEPTRCCDPTGCGDPLGCMDGGAAGECRGMGG